MRVPVPGDVKNFGPGIGYRRFGTDLTWHRLEGDDVTLWRLDANAAAGADDIVFQSGLTGTITLTGGELAITESATITGNGAANTVIDAQQMSRIFNVSQPGATAVDVSLTGPFDVV